MRLIQIAIDGPAGAGKSTIAKMLAEKLGYIYIDTGAMYRAVTLAAIQNGTDCKDGEALAALAENSQIELIRTEDGQQLVYWNGKDVTLDIRSPQVSQLVSHVSSHECVRNEMVRKQKALAQRGKVVMDGRDIGTVVMPQAQCKLYLTASLAERAKRRYEELISRGYSPNLVEIQEELEERDWQDKNRKIGPLKRAEDAVLMDTTNLSQDEVLQAILRIYQRKEGEM